MIQRIQTIFLLLTAILMGVTIICPLLGIDDGSKFIQSFHSYGIGVFGSGCHTWGVLTFAVLGTLLPLINIFLYKKRKLQANIGLLTALCIIIFYVTFAVYLNAFLGKMDEYIIQVQVGIILPVIALIFDLLAVSKIKKDEKLVKSLDRIR
ncbi:uncharacterized BrkB/YihY/UPF0761 family membrane protein [Dysgonomonas hofstadii]|uniref:Uncharacterized BrkB/YihY/UPF0761 family membrane protein n=1 Tax=Dysgonomonas hofstadii TaxID=637886 RepID=A0A840CRL1_9BACT|nr:DUF4293 domain-containing protein [Dysgonomonas hofstadii]MBB4035172.1 uncharacterized BrkB/YihY/UPF0761 family membrane protein [Dysgonomonas hofstadii]